MRILPALCIATAFLAPVHASAEGKSIIVLDASGSMWGQIDGRAKLEIAREALGTVLSGMDPATEIGLMAYGHREKGSCTDIEVVVPPAAGTGQLIVDAANTMKFLGKTPLSEAVKRAAEELRYTEEAASVILITDGIETCEADPCALGVALEEAGVNFTAHVVGFGLTEAEGRAVACLAENTGGTYIQASDAGTLVEALKTTVVVTEPVPEPVPEPIPEPEPVVALEFNLAPQLYLSEGGPAIEDGQAWEIFALTEDRTQGERISTEYNQYRGLLPAGNYRLLGRIGEARAELDITLTDDALLEPQVILNAGMLVLRPRIAEGAPVDTGAALDIRNASGMDSTYYGEMRAVVPAGEIQIGLRFGAAKTTESVTLAAGETLEKDVILGGGLAVIDAFYVEGMIMDTTQHGVEVVKAQKALDGSQESVAFAYGPEQLFVLLPGDYVVRVKQDAAEAEVAFTVKPGERVDVPVILNAGVLAISAPGATSLEVVDAKADISGNRTSRGITYSETLDLVAPGGDYLVVTRRDETFVETPVTITPGERSEISVP